MGRTGSRIPPVGISWEEIKSKLESEGAKNKAYDSDLDGVFDTEAIPTITRDKLEYPTENVTFAYLIAIGKATYARIFGVAGRTGGFVTVDSFTDKALKTMIPEDCRSPMSRWQDENNAYYTYMENGGSTADHQIRKYEGGSETSLGTEAVDLRDDDVYLVIHSVSGSTIKSFREDLTTPKITVTDTTFASGRFGHGFTYHQNATPVYMELIAPASPSPKALAVIEVEPNDFYKDLREISQLSGLPDFLYEEAKKYETLKAKGFTDEEIELLFGTIPQHQVDLASVTWGAFDYKGEATMLCVITGDNPYQEGAILKQIEHAKSKNLKVYKPPIDLTEARDLHRQIKADRPEIIAGVHNLAYQCLGYADLEPLAVADFYDGFVQGIYDWKDLEKVPSWELERTIKRWMQRLEKASINAEEKEKHMRKLKQVLKA